MVEIGAMAQEPSNEPEASASLKQDSQLKEIHVRAKGGGVSAAASFGAAEAAGNTALAAGAESARAVSPLADEVAKVQKDLDSFAPDVQAAILACLRAAEKTFLLTGQIKESVDDLWVANAITALRADSPLVAAAKGVIGLALKTGAAGLGKLLLPKAP